MTRVLASSVGVLDDATSMTSQIDAVLAGSDPDYDWSPEIDWWPGDPLYTDPRVMYDESQMRIREAERRRDWEEVDRIEAEWRGGPVGNHVRPMFELAGRRVRMFSNGELEEYFVRDDTMESNDESFRWYCASCEACGDPRDNECWLCGKAYRPHVKMSELKTKMNLGSYNFTPPERITLSHFDFSPMVRAMDEMAESWRAANEAFRQMSQQLVTYAAMDARLSSRMVFSRGGYVLGRSIFDEAFRTDTEERSETSRVRVLQSDVDAVQETPDLLRRYSSGMPSDRPRTPQEHARVGVPLFNYLPDFLVVTELEIPNEIPTSYIPPADYTASEGVDYLIRRELVEEPAYVRLIREDLRTNRNHI